MAGCSWTDLLILVSNWGGPQTASTEEHGATGEESSTQRRQQLACRLARWERLNVQMGARSGKDGIGEKQAGLARRLLTACSYCAAITTCFQRGVTTMFVEFCRARMAHVPNAKRHTLLHASQRFCTESCFAKHQSYGATSSHSSFTILMMRIA